ncbi:MarR family winged helix-turn-helix transcriptional regulator [Kitasatospora sp. NPDC051164]|uniref:MarR family winged helix-turn-helix transcriptional regulator n=1 Tax=Kitasatospora sp. NPDC051164 TaxID=3364055 RepID=UPI0037B9D49C
MKNSTGHDIADALGLLMRRSTHARLHTQLTEGLGEAVDDLTYPILSGLARTGACSAADLGREIGLDRTTVTRRADRLEQAHLLRRHPDPAHGRATLSPLLPAGGAAKRGRRATAQRTTRHAAGAQHQVAGIPSPAPALRADSSAPLLRRPGARTSPGTRRSAQGEVPVSRGTRSSSPHACGAAVANGPSTGISPIPSAS